MKASEACSLDGSLIDAWRDSGGLYVCPKDSQGRRLGPLVGYAGQYPSGDGKAMHNYVGEAYFSFATVEELWHVLDAFAKQLTQQIREQVGIPDWVLGAPMGGLALAQAVARCLDCRYLYAEKKVLEVAAEGRRERSELVFGRHQPQLGTCGVGLEDVFHNFSTTGELVALAARHGAAIVGMGGALNRSDRLDFSDGDRVIPVVSVLHIPTPQYRQDDPEVAGDVESGKIVWRPKAEWGRLMAVMQV